MDLENKEGEEMLDRVQALEERFELIESLLSEIKNQVSEKSYRQKVATANSLMKSLEELDGKVTENMKRLNDMLLKLKGCVAIAIGNMAN